MKPFSPIQMHASPVLGRFTLSSMKMKPFSPIQMLERVNLPKTGDACICMGEKGFIFMPDRVNMVEKVYPLQHENEAFFYHVYPVRHENEAFFSHTNACITPKLVMHAFVWEKKASFSCRTG
jgi:hypothetical protein